MAEFKVITGTDLKNLSRFSYVYVFEPKKDLKKDPKDWKYEVSILIPKSDKKGVKMLKAAIEGAKEDGIERKVYKGKILEKNFHYPLKDGDDEEREDDEAYHGHYYLSARTSIKPGIRDKQNEAITDRTEFYSGCFGRASVSFFPYEVEGKKGVGVSLNGLQKVKDGDSLGGGSSNAEKDFEDYKVDEDDIDEDDMLG